VKKKKKLQYPIAWGGGRPMVHRGAGQLQREVGKNCFQRGPLLCCDHGFWGMWKLSLATEKNRVSVEFSVNQKSEREALPIKSREVKPRRDRANFSTRDLGVGHIVS